MDGSKDIANSKNGIKGVKKKLLHFYSATNKIVHTRTISGMFAVLGKKTNQMTYIKD